MRGGEMISNERQYQISLAQLSRFKQALLDFDVEEAEVRTGSRVIAKAEYNALESQLMDLREQVMEYEELKSGAVSVLTAQSLEEFPEILIKARIVNGLSQRALAELLNMKEQQIQRYEAENYASASLRRIREVAEALGIVVSEIAKFEKTRISPSAGTINDLDWSKFPIEEMYRRNWFIGFEGSLAAARADSEGLVRKFMSRVYPQPTRAFLRHSYRFGSIVDLYSLVAWKCRVLSIAQDQLLKKRFLLRNISTQWLQTLVKSSQYEDGPQRAKKHLENIGIHLVIEPHLANTYLDGAALLSRDGSIVIGLTLRYDRIDNFWFTLLHEIAHVLKHLRKKRLEYIFDDLEAPPDKIEKEADQITANLLIPDEKWETALARYIRTEEPVLQLANELKISPAIVAGRIRRESENYMLLPKLIGQGEVRKHFSDVQFGR
jgi:HTH-type transcriptional regulator/antitoxin HigA